MKKRKRHGPDEIIKKLRDAELAAGQGEDLATILQRLEVSEQTYYRWKQQYGGMKAPDAKRLKNLERENAQLKKLVADLSLDNSMLKEIARAVPQKQHKKRPIGSSANGCTRRKAEHRDHVWTYDFVLDRTDDGRTLKFLTVIDEFTRECLALPVGRHFTSQDVIAVLSVFVEQRGVPERFRSDNGPEFVAAAIRAWLARTGIATAYIEPGSPWENAYIETFNGKLRDELLKREIFMTVAEAKHLAAGFRFECNNNRPHSSLGYKTLHEFAAGCAPFGSATLRLRAHTRTVS